jgi:O-antigen/teichoic acid export membrane protein
MAAGLLRALFLHPPDGASEEDVRAADRHRRAAWTTLTALVSKAVSVLTSLLSVSLTISYLGKERYGLWVAVSSFVATLAFADFGLGNGLMTLVANAHGRDDVIAARTAISSAFAALSTVAVALLAVLVVSMFTVDWPSLFHVHGMLAEAEARPVVFVLGALLVLNIPLDVVMRVQTGRQEGYFTNFWQMAGNLLALAGLVAAATLHLGLPLLAVAVTGAPLLATLANGVSFFGVRHRELLPSPRYVSRVTAGRLLRLGLQFMVMQICVGIIYSSDALIVARVVDASAVAPYAVSSRLMNVQALLLGMALSPLWPAYTEAFARGDVGWVRRTLRRSLTLAAGWWLAMSTVLVVAGPWIIGVWTHGTVSSSRGLLLALAGWNGCLAIGGALSTFLNAMSVLRIQVMTSIAMTVVGTAVRIAMCSAFGTAGMVWGTTVSYLLVAMLPIAYVVARQMRTMPTRPRSDQPESA